MHTLLVCLLLQYLPASHPSLLARHKPAEMYYPVKLYKLKEGESRALLGTLSNHRILSGTGQHLRCQIVRPHGLY